MFLEIRDWITLKITLWNIWICGKLDSCFPLFLLQSLKSVFTDKEMWKINLLVIYIKVGAHKVE